MRQLFYKDEKDGRIYFEYSEYANRSCRLELKESLAQIRRAYYRLLYRSLWYMINDFYYFSRRPYLYYKNWKCGLGFPELQSLWF